MKRMFLIIGMAVGVLILSGCSSSDTPPAEMTVADFKTKLQGSWDFQKNGNSCIDSTEAGTSSITNLIFTETEFKDTRKKYSELGCKETDLNFDATYTYRYTLGKKQTPDNVKITSAFEMDIAYTGLELRKGTLDSVPSGETLYLTAGLDTAGHLEFAIIDDDFGTDKKENRPTDFNTSDAYFFDKQE
jgi:hypothetical protein